MTRYKAETKIHFKGINKGDDEFILEEGTFFDWCPDTYEITLIDSDGTSYTNSKMVAAVTAGWVKECKVHEGETTINGSVDFMKK